MNFSKFVSVVHTQFQSMAKSTLYEVDVNKDELYEAYIKAFPEGTNPLYNERTEHECNTCKNFIRDVGAAVTIKDGKLITIWDVVDPDYQVIADTLADLVRSKAIKNILSTHSAKVGAKETHQQLDNGKVKKWNHFYGVVPAAHVQIEPSKLGRIATTVQVFKRGLEEITKESVSIVLELISQNSIYRGQEFNKVVQEFKTLQTKYKKLSTQEEKDIFLWENYKTQAAGIRNIVIGTLLTDLSEGKELDAAVKSFEDKVAPANYRKYNS